MTTSAYQTTRYVPLTQQHYLCLPTCLQMVLLHQHLALLPAETLAHPLGLIVPPEDAELFVKPRTSPDPAGGYGTRIDVPRYSFARAMAHFGYPLAIHHITPAAIGSPQALATYLADLEQRDGDALIIYRYDGLFTNGHPHGHVNLFDRVRGTRIRLIEPGVDSPKFTLAAPSVLYDAMQLTSPQAPDRVRGGIWEITRTD